MLLARCIWIVSLNLRLLTSKHAHPPASAPATQQQPNQSRRMAHEFAEVYKKCKQIADSAHHSSDLLDGDLSYELGVFGLLRPHYFNEQPKMSPKMIEVYQREHKIFWTVVCAELPAAAERRKRHMTPP